jgi:flagellar motor protein MotB
VFRWALPASVVVHLAIAALLIFGLPVSLSEPEKDEAIAVDLVPPPKSPDKPKPEQKPKAEPPPQAEAPKPEKQQEAKNKTPPPTSNDAARPPPSPVLRPVHQFGEKDAGPRESREGDSAEEGSHSPAAARDPGKQDLAEPPALAAVGAMNQAPKPGAPEMPAPKPADAAKVQKPVKLQKAKTLYSRAATGDPIATTATGNVPLGVRAGQLCATELGEQLANASPPYFGARVPRYVLNDGTALEIRGGVFFANGRWYNLSFRCEVDADAMKVVSFAFHVGDPVPRSEWKSRGLPSY